MFARLSNKFKQMITVLSFFHNLPEFFDLFQTDTGKHNLLRALLVVSLNLIAARYIVAYGRLKIHEGEFVLLSFG